MVSRSLFLFPVYKRHFVFSLSGVGMFHMIFYGDHYRSVSDVTSSGLGARENVSIASGISQICYSYQKKLFPFEVYRRHFVFFPVIIIYLCRAHHTSFESGAPENIGIAVGISQSCSYQKLFLFPVYKRHFILALWRPHVPYVFTVIIIYLCRTYTSFESGALKI